MKKQPKKMALEEDIFGHKGKSDGEADNLLLWYNTESNMYRLMSIH